MLCEKYKDALIEAAVGGAELAPGVRAHVEGCARCAVELDQQRSLVGAMDAVVSRQMNAPVPAAMLQRLDVQIAQQPQSRRTLRFASISAVALATLFFATVVLVMVARHRPQIDDVKRTSPPVVKSPQVDQMQLFTKTPKSQTPTETEAAKRAVAVEVRRTGSHQGRSGGQLPEVLVPPDERIALEHFIAGVQPREGIALALSARVPERDVAVAPLNVPDIQTASLSVPPIGDSEAISRK